MLKQKARTAVFWSGGDILLRQSIQTVVSIALARMLTPEAFGAVALLSLFTAMADILVDSGFASALVQKQNATIADETTVFWLNLGIGVAASIVLLCIAPSIARFYRLPVLTSLMAAFALGVVLSALGSIQATLLVKRLDYRLLVKVSAGAKLCSGAAALWMAWRGWGVWALAVQSVSATAVATALLWAMSPWRPAWVFSLRSAKALFGFGGYMLLTALLNAAYERGYSLLIGKFYGTRELGYYGRADSLQQLPSGLLSGLISRVTFPLFSAARDRAQLQRGVRLAIRSAMLINVPVMLGMLTVASPLVPLLLGSQWKPVVPLLRILCLAGVLAPLQVINLDALRAQGHSRLFFRLTVIKTALGCALVVVGSFFGPIGLAWSQVVTAALAFPISAHYTGTLLGYGAVAQLRDIFPVMVISTAMALSVAWTGSLWVEDSALKLATMVGLGAGIFFAIAFSVRLASMREALALARGGELKSQSG
jgi:O-antigen/teichoic acid export membrane protein